MERKLAEGARQAREKLEPARLAVAWGYAQANINRRTRDAEGQARMGMNPDVPVDRRIGLIRLDRAGGGAPLALVANYAMHATVLGAQSTLVSADAPGVVAEYVEGRIGAPMELFCDVAQDIRDRSPFPDTLHFGYANGTFAYLPNEREFLAGGYEAATSPFTAAVQRHLRDLRAAP